jgi:transcription termination factor Rho
MINKDLQKLSILDLQDLAHRYGIIGSHYLSKEDLIIKIKEIEANPEKEIDAHGVLERMVDGYGFLRSVRSDYISGEDDIYVSHNIIRKFNLRPGDTVHGTIKRPREGEKYFALSRVNLINYQDPELSFERPIFEYLTPIHPVKKFNIEQSGYISTRLMDLFSPIGKGQRGLIVAPPKAGKTILLKELADTLGRNHPETFVIILLIDERPEEVADMRRSIVYPNVEIVSSTFDESAERHIQVSEVVIAKAKRLVEAGKDVIILLDSITRLARAYNTTAPTSGKVLTGGVDAYALQQPKKFFGAARATETAGSLTILASALVETGSKMDEVIFEEFKGTGNMEIHLSRKLANLRVFPALDLVLSGTRREELMLQDELLQKIHVLRKFVSSMNIIEAMEILIDRMKKTKTNSEFLDSMNGKNK